MWGVTEQSKQLVEELGTVNFFCCALGIAAGVEEDDEASAATGAEVEDPGAGVTDHR